MPKEWDCSCWVEYPNESHIHRNGKWKCKDIYEYVGKSKQGCTHCRKKVEEMAEINIEKLVENALEFAFSEIMNNTGMTLKECYEKQIPKKKHKYMGYRCVCGTEVAKNQKYCDDCGQRLLDWGNE